MDQYYSKRKISKTIYGKTEKPLNKTHKKKIEKYNTMGPLCIKYLSISSLANKLATTLAFFGMYLELMSRDSR